ncbi:UDP-glucose 4-epimerase GalE [Campylobacter mucosalis]|uniref:UDP-glucose 4-epimerase GalE n=1 Tax=Campylobacter mucosalis TaxID=202 RepID=UPI00146FEE1E|nr:UDP-glucose 4-epimerase GalE [Campylobacter mucosalis]
MNILITGGAGYIGSHVLKALLELKEHKISVIDDLSKGSLNAINELKKIADFSFFNLSLEDDLDEIFKNGNFDAIIHFAAFIEVFESTQNPLKYYLNNTANVARVLTYCQKYGVNRFIFSSTAAVYGEPDTAEVNETSPTNPINPYGHSKLMSEQIIKDFAAANSNFRYAILRYFNVAGASIDNTIGQNYPNATHLIKVAVQTALKKKEQMSVFGRDYATKDGTCVRDYIHVCDLANAHISALNYINKNESETFNVGYGRGFSVLEVIEITKAVSGVNFKILDAPRREGDPAILIANSNKLREKTDWKPKFDDLKLIVKTALEWEKKI